MIESTTMPGLVLAITLLGLGVLVGYGLGRRDTRTPQLPARVEPAPHLWAPPATAWAPVAVQALSEPAPAPMPPLSDPMAYPPLADLDRQVIHTSTAQQVSTPTVPVAAVLSGPARHQKASDEPGFVIRAPGERSQFMQAVTPAVEEVGS